MDSRRRDWTPVLALGGLGLLALVLVVGVLIGQSGSKQTAAGPPQVIRLDAGGPAATSTPNTAQNASFSSDWPSGKRGYTVEIGELPKDGTTAAAVQAAKTQAQQQGAPQVGALDSDSYPSLPSGKYVVYSGVFEQRPPATAALAKLKAKFPQAKVVQVGDTAAAGGSLSSASGSKPATASQQQLQQLDSLKGPEASKQSRKLPKTIAIPGPPPSPDNKPAGGGSSGETIK